MQIVSTDIAEVRAVSLPVAGKTALPSSSPGQTDSVAGIRSVGKVENKNSIIPCPALIPAVIGNKFVPIIHMIGIDMLSPQPPCVVEPVSPQAAEISVQPEHPGKTLLA